MAYFLKELGRGLKLTDTLGRRESKIFNEQ